MNSPSMPLEPGDKARVRNSADVFEVVDFDGSLYRLKSEHGAELRAGRLAVQRVMEPADDTATGAP